MARLQLLALAATLLLAVSSVSAAGGRQLRDAAVAAAPTSMAGAPGPSAGKPPADILFTVSGSRAELTANKLKLTGVAPVALHTTSGQGADATPIGDFANSTASGMYVNSAGQWLADPVAVLVGTVDNAPVKALVKLSGPMLDDDDDRTLTFNATIVSSTSADALPTAGGVTARTVDDRGNGLADNLLTQPPSAKLTNAALFIDVNSQSLGKEAQTKFFGWLFGGPWGGWGGPGWGGYGYDRGYGYGGYGGWHHGWYGK